jgi:hypothetical protein
MYRSSLGKHLVFKHESTKERTVSACNGELSAFVTTNAVEVDAG